MRFSGIMTVAAFAAVLPTAAIAQPTASPHQHGQPVAPAQTPQSGQHKAPQSADGHCDCCEMMKGMMQMMQMMHQHGSQPGATQKMNMMPPPGSPPQSVVPGDAEHQQHEGRPQN